MQNDNLDSLITEIGSMCKKVGKSQFEQETINALLSILKELQEIRQSQQIETLTKAS